MGPLGMALGALLVAACSNGGDPPSSTPGAAPSFPADYASTYKEVRNCRQSGEHDLNRVRVVADPAAFGPYQARDRPIPVGAVVLKEEYDFADTTCSGPVKLWTVMQRREPGSSPTTLDWRWEEVDGQRNVIATDTPRCYGCHAGCTPDAGGYENTCEVP